jgi:hypothetical protein
MGSHSKISADLRPRRIAAQVERGVLGSTMSISESEAGQGTWLKSGFVDGTRNLWYNNVTREMEWRKPDVWEAGSNFRMESFIAEYGSAYFLTALSLSAMSFSSAYLLVTKSGIDLEPILSKLGLGVKSLCPPSPCPIVQPRPLRRPRPHAHPLPQPPF